MRSMRGATILLVVLLVSPALVSRAGTQQSGTQQDRGGALGGVLDTLGGILGAGTRKLEGTVVVSEGSTVVIRTGDRSTYRVDIASVDPATRAALRPGQQVTVTARGGQGGVLTATEIQPAGEAQGGTTFQQVRGTVQESGTERVLFKTADGLVLPVDVSRVHGLPYLATNQPATLYYEQGPRQEIVAVWIEPGTAASDTTGSSQPAAAPAATSPSARSLHGTVQSIGVGTLTLETSDGQTVAVDTRGVDPQAIATVRPGDAVDVTGTRPADGGAFAAQSVRTAR
jgi:hypothetical protein